MVGLFDLAGGKDLVPPQRCKGQFGSSVGLWRADEQWTNRLVGSRFSRGVPVVNGPLARAESFANGG